jgi:hypothetical protein
MQSDWGLTGCLAHAIDGAKVLFWFAVLAPDDRIAVDGVPLPFEPDVECHLPFYSLLHSWCRHIETR